MTDRRVLYIDDFCVAEEARGQGIGEALMDFAQNLARQKGCSKLTLTVWNDNAGALRFYEGLGMTPFRTMMELDL